MASRYPAVAGMFYPEDELTCRRELEEMLSAVEPVQTSGPVLGGVVPHAGWIYSGATAARVYAALSSQPPPETIILFGAVHNWGVSAPSLFGPGSWRTPLGELVIDAELEDALLRSGEDLYVVRPEAHSGEHAIEVQLPFVQYLFPQTRILPVAMPPSEFAPLAGRMAMAAARAIGRRVVAIGSSDLTHYGPRFGFAPGGVGERGREWMRRNDQRLLDVVVSLRADAIVPETSEHSNACGGGAIAATVAYATAMGATRGLLLGYTTSYDAVPQGRPTDLVGYGAVILT